ncbi:hypothetical protein Y032_1172g3725 [Ancylostoma ceylanicum]|uniref:Uncharacterized protein n=1 Tax=Ancylostoma ceylanicum TaxID=53326 RepID=A0A016W7U2_9BILA|nr:hypothetical protein Y032_1172g3725 [Ancylostoma ceylanicum]
MDIRVLSQYPLFVRAVFGEMDRCLIDFAVLKFTPKKNYYLHHLKSRTLELAFYSLARPGELLYHLSVFVIHIQMYSAHTCT